jgi:hypothetical protein
MEDEMLLQPGDRLRIGPIVFQVPGAKMDIANVAGTPDPPASDDDIASWLSSDGIRTADGHVAGSGDTTIIPRMPPEQESSELHAMPPKAPAAREVPAAQEQKRQFRNVAEEAADIIRRHWEMVKAEEVEE